MKTRKHRKLILKRYKYSILYIIVFLNVEKARYSTIAYYWNSV